MLNRGHRNGLPTAGGTLFGGGVQPTIDPPSQLQCPSANPLFSALSSWGLLLLER